MSDADCTPGREPRSVAASFVINFKLYFFGIFNLFFVKLIYARTNTGMWQ